MKLFQPLQIGPLTLANRVFMAPLTRLRSLEPGDVPTTMMAEYYRQRASAGLIITEATQISFQAKGYSGSPGIHSAEQIAAWRKAGYQDQEDYANFAELLSAPKAEIGELLADRFPIPRYIVCDQGGSQARFLLSRINPSTTHSGGGQYGAQPNAQAVFTDDVSLQTFMEHLKKLAVSQSS